MRTLIEETRQAAELEESDGDQQRRDGDRAAAAVANVVMKGWADAPKDRENPKAWLHIAEKYVDHLVPRHMGAIWIKAFKLGLIGHGMIPSKSRWGESTDALGELLEGLRGENGLGEAKRTFDDLLPQEKEAIEKVAKAILADLKKRGAKRVRITTRRNSMNIGVTDKSFPGAPQDNLVSFVKSVMDPVAELCKKMGGQESNQPLPGGTRYITFPNMGGIRVIGGSDYVGKCYITVTTP